MKNKRGRKSKKGTLRRLISVASNRKHRWKEDDRVWFLANPDRFFRLRRLYVGEIPGRFYRGQTHVLVRKIRSNCRDKQFWSDETHGKDLDTLPNNDSMGIVLWLALKKHIPVLSVDKFIRDAAELEQTEGVEITEDMVFFNA